MDPVTPVVGQGKEAEEEILLAEDESDPVETLTIMVTGCEYFVTAIIVGIQSDVCQQCEKTVSDLEDKPAKRSRQIEEINKQVADLERGLGTREEEIDRLKRYTSSAGCRLLHVLTLTSAYFYNVCSMTSKHAVRNVRPIWTINNKLYMIYKGVTCHFNTAFLKTNMQKCLILMRHVKDLEGLEDFAGRNESEKVFSCQSWL